MSGSYWDLEAWENPWTSIFPSANAVERFRKESNTD